MSEPAESSPMIGVEHYERLTAARDAALVLAARGLTYEIAPIGRTWVLLVEAEHAEEALRELRAVPAEETAPTDVPLAPLRWQPLIAPALVMAAFMYLQGRFPAWTDAGLADSQAIIFRHEWWRTLTALTLHADGGHFLANLCTGLLFAAFLTPALGAGVTWLLIVASGGVGNLLNAWQYRHEEHLSLGASTAVFGALGLLVATESWARWRAPETRNRWQLIIPIGAGLTLLAYLGVGEAHEHIDFMAHGWGFFAGLVQGALWSGRRLPTSGQWVAGSLTLSSLAFAWFLTRGQAL